METAKENAWRPTTLQQAGLRLRARLQKTPIASARLRNTVWMMEFRLNFRKRTRDNHKVMRVNSRVQRSPRARPSGHLGGRLRRTAEGKIERL